MNFPARITNLIMSCLSSASMSVLWNGVVCERFKPRRGVRQGCPLPPYLFLFCLERLANVIEDSVHSGDWKPIQFCRRGLSLSHLFYADDIILFGEASSCQVQVIKGVLDSFSQASGEVINLSKSKICCSANVSLSIRTILSRASGIALTNDFGRYLGVPILRGRKTKRAYQALVDRVKSRLSRWKADCLNLAGRVTLAQSVLCALPMYTMQSSLLPKVVCDELDKIVRTFICNDSEERRRLHLLGWDILSRPRDAGGWGIRASSKQNEALMAKLAWNFLNQTQLPWVQLLRERYQRQLPFHNSLFKPGDSQVWRGLTVGLKILNEGLRRRIGNGSDTRFWDDVWFVVASGTCFLSYS